MAEGSVSSNEPPLKKLRPQEEVHRFRWLQGPGGSLKIEKIQDVPISSPIENISPIKKSTIRDELKSLNFVLRSLEIHGVTISSSWLSSLLSSLSSSLSSLKFLQINEFVWTPELGDLRSLPTLYEDWVNKKRSNDSVSPDREEDNHVSSGNNGGRLDDHSGSNDGIKGVESLVESVIEQWLRHQDVNLGSLKTIFENFDVKDHLTTDPLFNTVLTQKMNDVHMDLLRVLETNSDLSSEELKEYYPPICWNSTKRLEFFVGLSDRLLLKATPNRQDQLKVLLRKELASKKPLILNEKWNKDIDPNFRADTGNSSQRNYNYKSVEDLLRFIRNNWHHRQELPEKFKLIFTGQGGEKRFYDYFNERFPNLLIESYRVASRFCREEKFRKEETWFENFC